MTRRTTISRTLSGQLRGEPSRQLAPRCLSWPLPGLLDPAPTARSRPDPRTGVSAPAAPGHALVVCAFSFAAAETHWLYGVPCWPATCFLLSFAHALAGLSVALVASLAIAVTHWLNGVPCWPATCFLLSLLQKTPYAFAFAGSVACGPGVGVVSGLPSSWPGLPR